MAKGINNDLRDTILELFKLVDGWDYSVDYKKQGYRTIQEADGKPHEEATNDSYFTVGKEKQEYWDYQDRIDDIKKNLIQSLFVKENREWVNDRKVTFKKKLQKLLVEVLGLEYEQFEVEYPEFDTDPNTGMISQEGLHRELVIQPMSHYYILQAHETLCSCLNMLLNPGAGELRSYFLKGRYHEPLFKHMVVEGLISGATSFSQFTRAFSGSTLNDRIDIMITAAAPKPGHSNKFVIIHLLEKLSSSVGLIIPQIKGTQREKGVIFSKVFCNLDGTSFSEGACVQSYRYAGQREDPVVSSIIDQLV